MDVTENKVNTLRASSNHPQIVFENHGQDARYTGPLKCSPTLRASYGTGGNNQPLVYFDVRFTSENSKESRGNVYETETARTLDTSGNGPDRNQGGIAVVYSTSKTSYHTIAAKDLANTLVASDYTDSPIVNENEDAVRRLTPTECARLQGFPDTWCSELGIEAPTDEDLAEWREIFNTYAAVMGKKPKSDNQIITWLKNPHSDTAEYKMWGNGVALPNVYFVLSGIKWLGDMT